jgi:hypothetical protein
MSRLLLCVLVLCAGVGCDKAPIDPPLPPPKFEVAPAPPGALGAKAAGTDAAPGPPAEELNPWGTEEEQAAPPQPTPLKPSDAGPAGTPDAGGLPL